MATKYARAGGGNWTADATWSTTSGGSADTTAPTAADDVRFDASSGNVTVDASVVCRSLDCNGYTGTLTHTANTIAIGDGTAGAGNRALRFSAGMTYNNGTSSTLISFVSTSATVQTIDSGGKGLSNLTFNGVGGSWQFVSTITATDYALSTLSLTNGTLDTNNQTVTTVQLSSTGSSTRVLTLGSSSITITGISAGNCFDLAAGTGLTLNAGTSSITLTGATNRVQSVNFGGKTYNNFTFTGGGIFACSGAATFANLTISGGAAQDSIVAFGSSITVTTLLTTTGDSVTNRLIVTSQADASAITITAASTTLTNTDFCFITAAGAAGWTGTSLGDATGNTGITFTTPVTRYWVGGTGNWNSTSEWSASSGGASGASVPLCHDDVVFDANSFSAGSQVVTANMSRWGRNISFAAVTNNPTLTISGSFANARTAQGIFGDLTLSSAMSITAGTQILGFAGGNSQTLTTAGLTIGTTITIAKRTGTLTLAGNLVGNSARTLTLQTGGFDADTYNVTMGLFDAGAAATKSISMGSGTWTMEGTGSAWNMGTSGSITFNAETSTLILNNTSATAKSFTGASRTYNIVTISGDNVTITGNNTFDTLNVNTAGLTNGLKLVQSGTQTVNNFATNGSSGNLAKLVSSNAAVSYNLSKSSGIVSVDYMDIARCNATGGASWYAGANSTDSGNNTGWVFTAPPSGTQDNDERDAHLIGTATATSERAGRLTGYDLPPTVALDTADEHEFATDTPTLEFTGTDPSGDDITYQIQIFDQEP